MTKFSSSLWCSPGDLSVGGGRQTVGGGGGPLVMASSKKHRPVLGPNTRCCVKRRILTADRQTLAARLTAHCSSSQRRLPGATMTCVWNGWKVARGKLTLQSRSSGGKVPPPPPLKYPSRFKHELSEVLLSPFFPPQQQQQASVPISHRSYTSPIQNKRQRGHSGSRALSWLQIRLCVITLFSYGKHMTVNRSTIGLCVCLRTCIWLWALVRVRTRAHTHTHTHTQTGKYASVCVIRILGENEKGKFTEWESHSLNFLTELMFCKVIFKCAWKTALLLSKMSPSRMAWYLLWGWNTLSCSMFNLPVCVCVCVCVCVL